MGEGMTRRIEDLQAASTRKLEALSAAQVVGHARDTVRIFVRVNARRKTLDQARIAAGVIGVFVGVYDVCNLLAGLQMSYQLLALVRIDGNRSAIRGRQQIREVSKRATGVDLLDWHAPSYP